MNTSLETALADFETDDDLGKLSAKLAALSQSVHHLPLFDMSSTKDLGRPRKQDRNWVVALAIVVTVSIMASSFAYGLQSTRANARLRIALGRLDKTSYEQEADVFVSMVDPAEYATPGLQPQGTVSVSMRNVTFPCRIRWQVGDVEKVVEVSTGDSNIVLPAGSVTVFCEPIFTPYWYQPVGLYLVRDGQQQRLGSTLAKMVISLRDGDRVLLYFAQPSPPWNAVMLRVQDQWILVTLERPWANYQIEKLTDRNQKKLPNTALCWAREGTEALARELAENFVQHRGDKHWGKFRGDMDTSVIVPSTETQVAQPFREMSREEMARHLIRAFELLKGQRDPDGLSIAEQIEKAAEFLRQK
jgi:hypothetical protein